MSFGHLGKGALRVAKNYTKGYSDVQAKVRDATSNDPTPPSGTQMNEIAQMTYNQNDFVEVMEMIDKRLNDKGKNWRHVYKSLVVLDYCLHSGSENVVLYFKDNIYVIKTLKEFQYVDEDGKDEGGNVRQRAKDVTNLLQDESRLKEARRSHANMHDRMAGGSGRTGRESESNEDPDEDRNENTRRRHGTRKGGEDELRRTIEESKKSLATDQKKKEERDLEEAIRQSEDEEKKRKNAVDDSNASSLFDDQQPVHTNNPFPLTDPTPYSVGLQPQSTQQLQPQYTSLQPQFTAMAPQFTSFNPYQQQAQEAMQAEYMRQQHEYAQMQQNQMMQQAQIDEYTRQQQQLAVHQQSMAYQQPIMGQPTGYQQQPLMAQPTGFGSKNPFAPPGAQSQTPPVPSFNPSMFSQQNNGNNQPSFNLGGTFDHSGGASPVYNSTPQPTFSSPGPQSQAQQPQRGPTRADQEHSKLAGLFENREGGQDTFGNTGQLRYGAGQNPTNAIISQRTGNPFSMSMQQSQQSQNGQQPDERPFF